MAQELTLSIIKPDATRRNLTGAINDRFEKAGLRIVAQKRLHMSKDVAGQFYAVHNIATDSKGNIFTVETQHGQRLQKFTYRGMGPVPKEDQGVVWPKP